MEQTNRSFKFAYDQFDDLKIYMLFHVAGNLSEIIYE